MFYVLQNESVAARRRVPILLTDAATGTTAQSGVALTTIYAYVNSNGGSFSGGAGTVANSGFGQYYYEFDPSEIGTLGLAGIHVTALNCRDYDSIVQVAAFDLYSASSGATAYAIAQEVWNTDVSGFSSPSAGADLAAVSSVVGYIDGPISGVPQGVWNEDMGNYIGVTNSAGDYLYQLGTGTTGYPSAGGGISAYDVWDFVITGFGQTGSAAEYSTQTSFTVGNIETYVQTQTPQDIWTYSGIEGRTITGGAVSSVLDPVIFSSSQYSGIASSVWNVGTRTITGGIADTVSNVTGNVSGSVGSVLGNVSGNVVGSVNSVTTPVSIATASMSGIANSVWESTIPSHTTNNTFGKLVLRSDQASVEGNVTLRSAGGINMVDADIHRIDNDADAATNLKNILTGIGSTITGNLDGNVNGVINPVDVSTSSMTGIAGTVWGTDVSGYVSPSAGYDLANASAGGGISAYDVWNFDATGMSSPQQGAVLTDTLANTTTILSDITAIPNNVWAQDITGYVTPGEAGYELSQAAAGSGLTAGDVWSYVSRTITGGIADTVSNVTGNVSGSVGSVLGNVSGNVVGSVGSVTGNVSGSVNSVVSDVPVNESLISADVWSYVTRTLTSGGSGISAADVWSYGSRTITGGIADTVSNVTGNVSGSVGSVLGNVSGNVVGTVAAVTGNVSGNVIGSVGSVTGNVSGNVVGSVGSVTGNVAGTVAAVTGNVSGNVVGSVASVTNPVTFSSAQYASIASSVWNAGTRTLTSGGSGISAFDVWNFVLSDANTAEVDLVQAASGAGLTAGDVWTYGSRTITGGLADTVTTITNPVTVGTNNDKTGYALSAGGVTAVQSGLSTLTQAQVGTEVDSSLSDVGLTSTVTGRIDVAVSSRLASSSYETPPTASSIASSVWSAGSRTITGGTVDNLTNPALVSTSSMTGIAGTVWNYASRTITGGGGATAGDVWTYGTRSLTSGAGITVNAATNIINGPYFVKSNVDGQDGNLDVIRGMVQDVQLTVTDAFQNPFDTTALGLAVNFYDQAGTLVTSYSTSELYGPAGLVQFTLDTAVTANEGRYNLILSAAGSGNTIKFGPLTTLVRPY